MTEKEYIERKAAAKAIISKRASGASESVKIKDLLDYCEKAADTLKNMQEAVLKNIGKGESKETALGAYAYFAQQETIYRYDIPRIINNLKKGDE